MNIFTYLCADGLFSSPGSGGAEEDRRQWLSPMASGSSQHPWCGPGGRGPGGNRPVPSGASKSGPCLMQQALGRPRKEILFAPECISSSELDADASGLQ